MDYFLGAFHDAVVVLGSVFKESLALNDGRRTVALFSNKSWQDNSKQSTLLGAFYAAAVVLGSVFKESLIIRHDPVMRG